MSMLARTVYCNLQSGERYVIENGSGAKSTMIYPRNTKVRFENLKRSADVIFSQNFRPEIADNDPAFYIRFHHGMNLTSASGFAAVKLRDLAENEERFLQYVVMRYSLSNQWPINTN